MESKVNYLLIGLFVLLLSAGGIAAVVWFSVGGFDRHPVRYLVYTDESVAGLSVDAGVSFMGVAVGRVAAITIDHDNPQRVAILLEVAAQTPIRTNTRAMLRMQGLTGLLSVDLVGTTGAAAPLPSSLDPPYPIIETEPSLMAHLEENASELLYEFKETAKRLNRLLDQPNLERSSAILSHLEQISGTLAAEQPLLQTALGDLAAMSARGREAGEALPQLLTELLQLTSGFRTAAGSLDRMAGELARTGRLLNDSIESSAGDVRHFTRDTLPEAAALVDDLYQAARNLRRLSERLEQDPSSIIFGAPERRLGPGEK